MDNIQRIPRPFGLTQLMIEYHSKNNIESFEIARMVTIQQWLVKNGMAFGQRMTVTQLAEFLQCSPALINEFMIKQMISTKIFNDENRQEWVDMIIAQQLAWNIEDRMDVQNQHDILSKSQGDSYKPFISAEITKILNAKQSATQNLGSLLSKMTSSQKNINIFNPVENQPKEEKPTYAEVIEIIQDEKNILSTKDVISNIDSKYDIKSLPEVNARNQTGIDVEKEGLHISNNELKKITDDYKGSIKDSEHEHHEMRREIELKIDDDTEIVPHLDYSIIKKLENKSKSKRNR